jgi:L-asparaginase II
VRAKPAEALLCAEGCDLLSGRDMIARWFGLTAGQTNARIDDCSIVTFKLPGKSTVYALKSANMEFWKSAAQDHQRRQRARG